MDRRPPTLLKETPIQVFSFEFFTELSRVTAIFGFKNQYFASYRDIIVVLTLKRNVENQCFPILFYLSTSSMKFHWFAKERNIFSFKSLSFFSFVKQAFKYFILFILRSIEGKQTKRRLNWIKLVNELCFAGTQPNVKFIINVPLLVFAGTQSELPQEKFLSMSYTKLFLVDPVKQN